MASNNIRQPTNAVPTLVALLDSYQLVFVSLYFELNGPTAVSKVTRRLDSALYEYSLCRLFVNAVVRMAYNERHGSVNFSQG